jgi:uncharacterized protein YndB with AHSA1/START domain
MQVTTPSDHEIVLAREFDAPREAVFAALTQPEHLRAWMQPSHMALVSCEVDLRAGGSFRYVFGRPNGRTIEVRGLYESVDPPREWIYTETYDFAPLTVRVTTTLDDVNGTTTYRQTLRYASKQERDGDFDGVATSAQEVYATLARYLAQMQSDARRPGA